MKFDAELYSVFNIGPKKEAERRAAFEKEKYLRVRVLP